MTAKRGGTRQAPATAAKKVAVAGAPVSPAEDELPLTPVVVANTDEVTDTVVEVTTEDTPATPEVDETAEEDAAPVVDRLAALAALTGAPVTPDSAPVVTPVVEANGDEVTWADGDAELVTGIVTFSVYQARVAGRTKQAHKGQTLHATEPVIARGVALGAVVRAD